MRLTTASSFSAKRTIATDGRGLTAGASARLKVNLAFTGVPVPAGTHRIELKYDTRSFWLGAGLSVLTLAIWLHAERRGRQGAGSIRSSAPSFSSVNT